MHDDPILSGVILDEADLTLEELCAACALEQAWLIRHVEEGLLPVSGARPADWRFSGALRRRARRMFELERDFEAVPELAALVADLLEEMDALRARVRRSG